MASKRNHRTRSRKTYKARLREARIFRGHQETKAERRMRLMMMTRF